MPDEESRLCKVHITLVDKINFACHQNAFAVLRELKVENLSAESGFSAIKVTLTSSPAFLTEKCLAVARALQDKGCAHKL